NFQLALITESDFTSHSHVKIPVVGTSTGVACCGRRPIRCGMPVTVEVRSNQKIEGAATICAKNRRKTKAGEEAVEQTSAGATLPGCLQDAPNRRLMALIEGRKRSF